MDSQFKRLVMKLVKNNVASSFGPSNARLRRPAQNKNRALKIALIRLLVIISTLMLYMSMFADFININSILVILSAMLLGYLYFEIINLRAYDHHLILLNPVVLASLITFALPFSLTNLLYIIPAEITALVGFSPVATPWMIELMVLVILAAVSMWVGFGSGLGRTLGRTLQKSRVFHRSFQFNRTAIFACLMLNLLGNIWAIKLGIFGYSSSYDVLVESAGYTQYFSLLAMVGKLGLIAAAFQYFNNSRPSPTDKQLFWFAFGFQLIFGFFSGFKNEVVMPFIIVGMAYYSYHGRLPKSFIPAILMSVVIAYAVIEPFRNARNDQNSGFVSTSVGSIASALSTGSQDTSSPGAASAPLILKVFSRINMTYTGSLGIEYAADHSELPKGSPEFLYDILMAPVTAVVPRFLWAGKSLDNSGLWYTNEVMNIDVYSASAMSPFVFLNFAGGTFAVLLGFFVVGFLQRFFFEGLRYSGGGGLLVLFGLLTTLTAIDNAFSSFIMEVIRFFPILVFVQYFLVRSAKQ